MKHDFGMKEQTHPHCFDMTNNLQKLNPNVPNCNSSSRIKLNPLQPFLPFSHSPQDPDSAQLGQSTESTMKVIIVTFLHESAMDIGPQETVSEIKQKMEFILGIPADLQTLSVLDFELADDLKLGDHPFITDGTRIDLIIGLDEFLSYDQTTPSKIEITIKFTSRQVTIEVDATETVRSLKEKIHIIDATPIKRMTLFFSGIEMEDELKTLAEYGVQNRSEVAVLLKSMSRLKESSAQAIKKLAVVVQTSSTLMNSASIPLEMKDSTTVGELKQVLLSRGILPMDDYIFIHKQRIMRDRCSLRWHGVENGDYLYVFKGTVSRGMDF